jgi:hypothetical protein
MSIKSKPNAVRGEKGALLHSTEVKTVSAHILSDHPKPANEYHLKTGQRE